MGTPETSNALIVIESCFGNTASIAEAVAVGVRSRGVQATVVEAAAAPGLDDVDLLFVGAPTHMMGLPTPSTRRQAEDKGGRPAASGISEWLDSLPGQDGRRTATFCTAVGKGLFAGSAAKAAAKRLSRNDAQVVARESFIVGATEGPLVDDELARAERWGASLV